METVTFTKTVNIADADGEPIREGSVLAEIGKDETGVVIKIVRKGDLIRGVMTPYVGDVHIRISAGVTRVTNRYAAWRHVPREKHSYEQRYLSWFHTEGSDDYASERISKDEQRAITGILALFPECPLDAGCDWPGSTEEALAILARHIDRMREEK